jgi:cell division septal protein FtsQ
VLERRPVKAPARPASTSPLKVRRAAARKRTLIIAGIIFALVLGGLLYLIWQPVVRVRDVSISAFDAASLDQPIKETLYGTYWMIIPRDSIFFFSSSDIRKAVLNDFPDIGSVSISRSGFNSLHVVATERQSVFDWCGESLTTATPDATCYETDAEGFIFAPSEAGIPDIDGTQTDKTLRIYAPLVEGTATSSPLRSHVTDASSIPEALTLMRALQSLGADIRALQLHGDEGDFYTALGTRITYVLGEEDSAAALAASAFPQLPLNDGSLEYVDLRFDGKVYFKKNGEAAQTQ